MNGHLNPFERGRLPIKPREFLARQMADHGMTREEAKQALRKLLADEVWLNDEYQVNVDHNAPHGFAGMRVVHLSIKRRDRGAVHDWRDLQAIKNALCGPEFEAVELYPAESRLVDTANQYHLFVLMPLKEGEPPPRLPFGWTTRLVMSHSTGGAVQRPLADPGPENSPDSMPLLKSRD